MKILLTSSRCDGRYSRGIHPQRVGGVDVSMGNFFELEVMLAIFTGGVPVTGGMPTRIFRLFVGALTIGVLVNGLTPL